MILFFYLVVIIILLILFSFYLYYQHSFAFWSTIHVRHPKPSFPFGNFNSKLLTKSGVIIQDIYNELRKSGAQYGGYYMFTMSIFLPLTPEMYKEIFTKNFKCFQDHGIYYDEEIEPLSAHLAALQGEEWKSIRSKLSPAFSPIKLKAMFPIMKKCSSDILQMSDLIEIHDVATRYTTHIICSCAFGIEENCLKNSNSLFLKYGRKLVEMNFIDSCRLALGVMAPDILKTFNISFINPKITKFFCDTVRGTVEYREKNNVKRNDLMDMLIQLKNNEDINGANINKNGKGLSVDQIAAQVFLFFIAGFETSAMALTCCMYELARCPNIQRKVREEILKVLQENDAEITYEGVNNMPYTDKVIQETLRIYPPIVMVNRICTQRYQLPGTNFTLDEGTRVVISTLGVHHDTEFYPEPQRFDPERFSDEEKAKRPSMTYFPFGDGPRICLGQKFAIIELKLALIAFLRDFTYSVHPSTSSNIRTKNNANMLGLQDKIWLKSDRI